ncbi:hypothetical protein QQS21_011419 [Conoideocrella luteorostrata]|uniref:Uncharacterized protein n=1 Tax=Conoideocrella luteorostrata TaxID=1105319 RepID=A0AAJ0FVW5_9HYPO|nr:hypothetical protein QQS21_011419 [Conoideocrella luteorostrata]
MESTPDGNVKHGVVVPVPLVKVSQFDDVPMTELDAVTVFGLQTGVTVTVVTRTLVFRADVAGLGSYVVMASEDCKAVVASDDDDEFWPDQGVLVKEVVVVDHKLVSVAVTISEVLFGSAVSVDATTLVDHVVRVT